MRIWAALALLLTGPAMAETGMLAPRDLVATPSDFRLHNTLHDLAPIAAASPALSPGLKWSAPESDAWPEGLPAPVLTLSDEVRHVLVGDLSGRRLYLYENRDGLRLLRQMYASIGKNGAGKQIQGDGRTPIGVYRITDFIHDDELPDLYGSGAFPMDYPNAWDRLRRRTGYGIWVHGVPRAAFSRPPQSSEGCVAVANAELDALKAFLEPGESRIVLTDQLGWQSQEERAARQALIEQRLEAWRSAWESVDTPLYLGFYSEDFRSGHMDREAFGRYKRQVNAAKEFIDLQLDRINIFAYPAEKPMMLTEFTQHYDSNNHRSVDQKQLFWQQNAAGEWVIVRELSL